MNEDRVRDSPYYFSSFFYSFILQKEGRRKELMLLLDTVAMMALYETC